MDPIECSITHAKNPIHEPPSLPDYLQETASYICSVQHKDGAIPWFKSGKLDPWDHIEAAMGLSVAGFWQEAESAYQWLHDNQLADGGWLSNYFCPPDDFTELRQTHFTAYIATGVWHHFLISGRRDFLESLYPCVARAVEAILPMQTDHGDFAWAFNGSLTPLDDALLTGCCSILRSLDCAVKITHSLGVSKPKWQEATNNLVSAIRFGPLRFDRHWESKQRFAMDWYYPVLSGALSQPESAQHLKQRWVEFIEQGLGCRCVTDQPWVTMAETSELIIALIACAEQAKAKALFDNIQKWRHQEDGGYWTGYVFRDDAIWPEEKTTWTAAAVILAADALYAFTPAHALFTQPIKSAVTKEV